MKSRAPRRMASTARSTLPQAVITITGSIAIERLNLLEQLEPFLPGGGVARIVQIDDDEVEIFVLEAPQNFRRRFSRFDLVAFALQQQTQRFEHIRLVVGDQDALL